MKVVMTCGGTGGHIYPAIAIADRIKKEYKDAEILFIGTKKGMENTIVPAAGYDIEGIDASGIDRRHLLNNAKTVRNLIKGGREVEKILKEFMPDMVIGTGGYVTGTVISHARRFGIPCYIHEQNAIPGVANRLLERVARKVFISFEASRSHFAHPQRCILTGNPIRSDFLTLDKESSRKTLGIAEEKVVLVFGGSLGALVLNEATMPLIDEIKGKGIKLIFVTGKRYFQGISEKLGMEASSGNELKFKDGVCIMPYADNMPVLMTAADLIVSRSGAIAVSEITASAKPSILVPSPNVTNNHQYHNAKAIADSGAALLLEEKTLADDERALAKLAMSLLEDDAKLKEMSECAKKIGITNAADVIFENLND